MSSLYNPFFDYNSGKEREIPISDSDEDSDIEYDPEGDPNNSDYEVDPYLTSDPREFMHRMILAELYEFFELVKMYSKICDEISQFKAPNCIQRVSKWGQGFHQIESRRAQIDRENIRVQYFSESVWWKGMGRDERSVKASECEMYLVSHQRRAEWAIKPWRADAPERLPMMNVDWDIEGPRVLVFSLPNWLMIKAEELSEKSRREKLRLLRLYGGEIKPILGNLCAAMSTEWI